jgi:8-oxo-dGTP diphosphatase
MSKPLIDVAAGLIFRSDGKMLLAERPPDKPWAGWWELPGGKIESGETVLQALSRELKEELNIDVTAATPWVTYTHDYEKRWVRLAFCRVTGWDGTAIGAEGQKLMWVNPNEPIAVGPLLPATEPPLRWIKIPERYLISSIQSQANLPVFLEKLAQSLKNKPTLVQFREPAWAANASADVVHAGFTQVLQCCRKMGAQCLSNSCHPEKWWPLADGVHFRAPDIGKIAENKATDRLTGASCHTVDELAQARNLGADFAVLGHVLATPSHPGERALGWTRFSELSRNAGLPVFAIGGQSTETLPQARQCGAHGIAGIRYL